MYRKILNRESNCSWDELDDLFDCSSISRSNSYKKIRPANEDATHLVFSFLPNYRPIYPVEIVYTMPPGITTFRGVAIAKYE